MWGDGRQTRSFMYVDECLEAVRRLMDSDFSEPINIGSEEMVTINQLAEMVMKVVGKKLTIKHIPGSLGVRGRNSDNRLIYEKLGWKPTMKLIEGIVRRTTLWPRRILGSRSRSARRSFSRRHVGRAKAGVSEK